VTKAAIAAIINNTKIFIFIGLMQT
jgi:hypothetical protein